MTKNMLSGKKIGAAVLMLTVILVSSCTTTAKSDDSSAAVNLMVQFDRAYIPALSMTNRGDAKGSEKAITFLIERWSELKPQFYGLFQGDKTDKKDLDAVNGFIIAAADEFVGGVELAEIHETLEQVKKPFKDIRTRNHIDYYLDLLEGYHSIMEEILDITADKTAADLTDYDIKEIHRLALMGMEQWNKIEKAPFDSRLFGFDQEKTDKLMTGIQNCMKEEEKFVSVVEEGDSSAIIAEAAALKPSYTKIYLLFGDFSRMK